MEKSIDYAKQRHQFGKPIGKFQSVSHKIADMKVKIELSKLMLYKIGWLKMQGKKGTVEAAIAKLFISEAFVKTAMDSLQIFGANGYMTEYPLERMLRDSIASTIYSGSSEIQKNIIAGWSGL
jgi:alkylation response protein AidB-like acyl-CoA dehydrogenase